MPLRCHITHSSKSRCTHTVAALKSDRIQPWTAGHTPYWVSANGQNWVMLRANLCVCVCLYQAQLFKATPKKHERILPISRPAVFWIDNSLSARNQDNPYCCTTRMPTAVPFLKIHWAIVRLPVCHPAGNQESIKEVLDDAHLLFGLDLQTSSHVSSSITLC